MTQSNSSGDVESVASSVIERTVARLQGLHDYAGRPAWEQVVAEELRAALASIPLPDKGVAQWQGIETAPKDGTKIDVWVGGEFPGRWTDVSWREPTDSEWWVHGGDTVETPNATWHCDLGGPLGKLNPPTHWMPLPPPPAIRALQDSEQPTNGGDYA